MFKTFRFQEQTLLVETNYDDQTTLTFSYYDRGDIEPSLVRMIPQQHMDHYINRFMHTPEQPDET